jgi:thiosulfate dehydrogenase [quinone] large subunit
MMDSSFRLPRTFSPDPCADGVADARLGRRRFLSVASRGAAAFAIAGLGAAVSSGCTIPPRSFQAPPGSTVRIPLAKFPELEQPGGIVKVFTAGHGPLFVRRDEGDSFLALSATCTHQGCTVAAARDGFRCPCHGSTYDREGRNTGGPAPRPLPHFSVSREGDTVVVDLKRAVEVRK